MFELRQYKKEMEQAMVDDELEAPFLGHYRNAASIGVKTILRMKISELKLFFKKSNHKKPDNEGECRLSLNILRDCGYARGLCEHLNTNIE